MQSQVRKVCTVGTEQRTRTAQHKAVLIMTLYDRATPARGSQCRPLAVIMFHFYKLLIGNDCVLIFDEDLCNLYK